MRLDRALKLAKAALQKKLNWLNIALDISREDRIIVKEEMEETREAQRRINELIKVFAEDYK